MYYLSIKPQKGVDFCDIVQGCTWSHEPYISAKKEGNDFYDIVGRIIDMGVRIVGVVPYTIARIFVFLMDFGATFLVGRNPWGQAPTVFLGILIYNTCTMLAGETGFALWRKANGKN